MKSPSIHRHNQQTSRHDGRTTVAQPGFPRTDYHYQSTSAVPAAAFSAKRQTREVYAGEARSFREISKPVLGAKFSWQFAVEAALLGLVCTMIAWSLVSMLIVFV